MCGGNRLLRDVGGLLQLNDPTLGLRGWFDFEECRDGWRHIDLMHDIQRSPGRDASTLGHENGAHIRMFRGITMATEIPAEEAQYVLCHTLDAGSTRKRERGLCHHNEITHP